MGVSVAYIVGGTAAAVGMGLILSFFGLLLHHALSTAAAVAVAGVVAMMCALADLGFVAMRLPQRRKQVPQSWRRRFAPEFTFAAYSAILGFGVATPVPFASFYALIAWTLLMGNLQAGIVVFGVYGFVRSLFPLLTSLLFIQGDRLGSVAARLTPWHAVVGRLSGVSLVVLAALSFRRLA